MNKITVVGRLTHDPDPSVTKGGVKFAAFTVASSRPTADGKGATDYFDVECWRTLAEKVTKFLSKDVKVVVYGGIQQRQYEDYDGATRTSSVIVAEDVEFFKQSDCAEP